MNLHRFAGKLCGPVALALAMAGSSAGVEPARDFLDKLREKQYFEEAIEYLDSLQDNPAVPVDFKETLLFERGLTLVDGARYKRDVSLREKDLNQAQQSLQKFLADHPEHIMAMSAKSQMANVTIDRGRMLLERSKKDAVKKDDLVAQAKAQFEQGIKAFRETTDDLKKKLENLPVIPDDLDVRDPKKQPLVKQKDQRDRWRTDYLQARLLAAAGQEELAEVYKPGSKEHTEALTAAAKDFGDIHDKYRRKLAGLRACQYQARCLLKIQGEKDDKNLKDALTYLNEITSETDGSPELRPVKMSAFALATEAWLKTGQFAESVLKGGAWLDDTRPNEQRDPELQDTRLNVAQAALKFAEDLKKKKDPASKDAKVALSKGRDYVNAAFKFGDAATRRKAGELLPQFPGAGADDGAGDDKVAKTFQEAKDFGQQAIESLSSARQIMQLLPARLKQETDSKIREEVQQQIKEAEETLSTAKGRAYKHFKTAMAKAVEDTPVADLNTVRYYLCFLEYDQANYFNALTYGEFLAFRQPDAQGAKQAALIAMAACQKLYAEEKSPDRDFESQRILRIAQYIVAKWPGEKEAEEALNTLIPFLIKAGRIDDAEKYVAQIPETSAYRGMAELKTGQALWANYLIGMRDIRTLEASLAEYEKEGAFPEGKTAASINAELAKMRQPLDTLKKRAQETLVEGIKRMQAAGEANAVVANASLSLSQIYVDTNQSEQAVGLLEDPKIGALTLVKNKHEAAAREGFAEEVFKTGLRAYISSLATSKDAAGTVAKAKEVMNSLKESMGSTPEGQQKLVLSYVGVAKDLQTQLEIASDDAARANLAKGFEAFLKQVGEQATDFNILNWVAETFRRMGDSFGRDKSNNPKKEAKVYYEEAIATYEKILAAAAKNDKFLPTANTKTALLRNVAVTYRDLAKYKDAADKFREILAGSPGLIAVQMEAAYNYQAWAGYDAKTVQYYSSAVSGWVDKKTSKQVIWGWKVLADKTSSDERFRSQFYESRYNLAYCRFKYGQAQKTDKELRAKVIKLSKLDVELTAKLYPDLGGDQSRPKFDALLKNIQKELGEQPRGLAAIAAETTSPMPVGTKIN